MGSMFYVTLMAFGVLPVGVVVALVLVAAVVVVAECFVKRLSSSGMAAVK